MAPRPSEISPLLTADASTRYGTSEVSSSSSDSSSSHTGPSTPETSSVIDSLSKDAGDSPNQWSAGRQVAKIISILLIGVLVAEIDGSMVMATYPLIGSEFNALASAAWLINGFGLAGAVTQPLYGKLSDIFGRKAVILVAYGVFTVGCAIVGLGQTMWQVILGRVISGAGSSGMTALVSILITDLVPIRDVAQWRSWVNIAATTGRSLGGPLGGWLADVIGWRWSFLGQTPAMTLTMLLCAVFLPSQTQKKQDALPSSSSATDGISSSEEEGKNTWQQLRRIDFKGAVLFGAMILAFLVPAQLGGDTLPWTHPAIAALFASSILLFIIFVAVERRTADAIIPLEIFHNRDAVLSYVIMGLQGGAQVGMMYSIPLYFQVTARASNAVAGAHLVPAVAGNCIGGLLSGILIKRSGRYKALAVFATISSSASYLLLMLRWHGNTSWLESLYIMPGGFGNGIAQSALFISLQAAVSSPKHIAPAVSMMYLATRVSITTGLVLTSATMRQFLWIGLGKRLESLGLDAGDRGEVMAKAVSDLGYVNNLHGVLRQAVVGAYVDGLWYSHGLSLLFSLTALAGTLLLRQRRLDQKH